MSAYVKRNSWSIAGIVALFWVVLGTAGLARADEAAPLPRHYVLAIEEGRIFVDLGQKDGVFDQQILQVFRTGVTFDHPISHEKLVGTTYLGDIKIVEVSDAFSIAEAPGPVLAQIKPGYEIRFRAQDAQAVQSTRERLKEQMEAALEDSESWEARVRRGMILYHNNNNKISAYSELVRFSDKDQYMRTEADFTYRLFRTVYAVRFGIGGLSGMGPVQGHDENGMSTTNTEKVAYYFGYSSIEFRLAPYLSFAPQFQVGLNNEGVGAGIGGNLRIGPELGTNLVFSGKIANLVGGQLALSYNHFINERLALSGNVAWENYVTGSSSPSSVRVLLGMHYDLTNRIQLDLRAGLGGRDVHDIGPSGLLGLSFNFPTGLWWMQELEGR